MGYVYCDIWSLFNIYIYTQQMLSEWQEAKEVRRAHSQLNSRMRGNLSAEDVAFSMK